ncbi:MAG: cytochrome c oxidase accessory protein CcoG [Comamonas sp.]|jgi:cytochrome c oxidase accessory protein FixG|nr:cytochrome c oxidase accessory protein CcoG [Comamonas sp.]
MSSEQKKPQKIIPIKAEGQENTVSFYEAHKKIYPRSISGRFMKWRWAMVWLTQLLFYGLPWLEWGQRQMVLFDLGTRRFYLFGYVLYPQDFIYLTGLLIISALALFLFTAVAGRLWCGFTCPQTVYTEIFMWIEHKVEGDRSARIRLDQSGWSAEKIWKKALKQFLWIAFALWTGFTFVGYFVPIRELGGELLAVEGGWQIFWVLFYGFATYGNAGYLREQVCKYMCPYARFQSAMFDKDTLVVSYDTQRGENRGPRKKGVDYQAQGLGDCIDCKLCVQVCPVGIDIRDGLQYECIGCGLCVDACNNVMDNMHYPRGLIRFTTENAVVKRWSSAQILRRIARPRVLIYGVVLLALSAAMVFSMAVREPLKVDVIRDRASLARIASGGKLENVYRLQVMNATEALQKYEVTVTGMQGIELVEGQVVEVDAAQTRGLAVRVQIPYGSAAAGSHPIEFEITAQSGQGHVLEKSVFLVPR